MMLQATHRHLVLVFASLLAACGLGEPSGEGKIQGPRYFGVDGREVETMVTPLVVTAGARVSVRCVVRLNGRLVEGEGVRIQVTPSAQVTVDGEGGSFVPTKSGPHHVACATGDNLAIDLRGLNVEVLPGAPMTIDTELELDTAAAGLPVSVRCSVRDAYGNASTQLASSLDAPNGVDIDKDPIGDFIVRGGPVGSWPVACRLGDIIDPTPEILRITTGIPGQTETEVNKHRAAPRETVSVTCYAKDDYGNTLTNAATSFYVLDAELQPEPGLTLVTGGFSASKAGTYFVFCNAPGFFAVDESPAAVEITPGLPHHWVVDLPNQDCLWQDRALPIAYEVYDVWNNLIPDAPLVVTTNPSDVVEQDENGRYRITEQGQYDVFVAVAGPYHANAQSLEAVLWDVVVDSTPPEVNITTPKRAESVVGGTILDSPQTITGTIKDTGSAIESFILNGAVRTVPAGARNMSLNATMTSRWGMNMITAVVQDECGNRGVVARSFLRSPDYFSASTYSNSFSRAPLGVLGHLNQVVIDDGNRADVDDLATIAERVIQSFDFNAEIPPGTLLSDPYALSCGGVCPSSESYEFKRHPSSSRKITWAGPYVNSIRAVNGGFQFDIWIGDFSFPYRLRAGLCGFYTICQEMDVELEGTIKADWVQATGTLGVTMGPLNTPVVSVASMSVESEDMNFSVNCASWAQWFCDIVTDAASGLAEEFVEDEMAESITEEIPGVAASVLGGFSIRTGFEVPEPLDIYLNVSSGFDFVRFCGPNAGIPGAACTSTGRSGQLGLYTQIYPSTRGYDLPLGARGAIRRDGEYPTFYTSPYAFGLGIRDDLVNQLLWAVWYSGALSMSAWEIEELAPDFDWSGITLSVMANSPPVLMPGRDGYEIQVGLGDVNMSATVDVMKLLGQPSTFAGYVSVTAYASILLGGSLDIDPATNELSIDVSPNPRLFVEVTSIEDPGYQGIVSDALTRVLELVAPNLLNQVLASFPIPSFNLSTIPGLPDTTWELSDADIARSGDYYRLTGSLR